MVKTRLSLSCANSNHGYCLFLLSIAADTLLNSFTDFLNHRPNLLPSVLPVNRAFVPPLVRKSLHDLFSGFARKLVHRIL